MITREQAKRCVGKGWSGLIDYFYDNVKPEAIVSDVKEKYGSLRINAYGDDTNLEMEVLEKSELVCEFCGEEGELRDLPWIKTLCNNCYKEYVERNKIKSANKSNDVVC